MEEDYLEGLVMKCHQLSPHMKEKLYVEMCHGVTVSNVAVALAEELGESKEFCDDIAVAGLLHDVGKLSLEEYLNDKPREETLNVERMKYVRMHPTHSCHALQSAGYSGELAKAVYYHHENMDGSGYPDNLRGEEIPWMSRILRVCDVFCALTCDRSYRRAFDKDTAMEIMIDEVEDYDMKIFLAFQRLLHSEKARQLERLRTVISPLQKQHLELFIKQVEQGDRQR